MDILEPAVPTVSRLMYFQQDSIPDAMLVPQYPADAFDCCSDGYLLLYRQRALASLVTVWSVLPGDVKHNLVTVSLDRYGEITAAFLAERTVILIAVESIGTTGIVSLKKRTWVSTFK